MSEEKCPICHDTKMMPGELVIGMCFNCHKKEIEFKKRHMGLVLKLADTTATRDTLFRERDEMQDQIAALKAELAEWKHRAIGGTCRILSDENCDCSLCLRDAKLKALREQLAEAAEEAEAWRGLPALVEKYSKERLAEAEATGRRTGLEEAKALFATFPCTDKATITYEGVRMEIDNVINEVKPANIAPLGPHVCDLPPHEVKPDDLVGTWGTHGGSVQVPSMRSVLDETESFIEIEGGRLRKAKPAEKDGGK